jgi:hypothetical protein
MTKHLAKLALAAALAAALPAAARGDDHRHGASCGHVRDAAGNWVAVQVQPFPAGWDDRDGRFDDHDGRLDRHDGRDGWRWRELREVRRELRELDAKRDAYHHRWAYHPRKLARFDRWYFSERDRLERRRAELRGWYAYNHR